MNTLIRSAGNSPIEYVVKSTFENESSETASVELSLKYKFVSIPCIDKVLELDVPTKIFENFQFKDDNNFKEIEKEYYDLITNQIVEHFKSIAIEDFGFSLSDFDDYFLLVRDFTYNDITEKFYIHYYKKSKTVQMDTKYNGGMIIPEFKIFDTLQFVLDSENYIKEISNLESEDL